MVRPTTSPCFRAMIPFLLALVSPAPAAQPLLGQVFQSPPSHLGPLLHDAGKPSIDRIRAHLRSHDIQAALWEAERFTDARRWGRDRNLAWMVQGMLHREAGRHNLASAAFTKVRASEGPLQSFGAYYEAEQDLARGKYWVAARECETYRQRFPEGRHARDCHRIMAVAYARAGARRKALETAEAYDRNHPHAPIGEQVQLTLALKLLEQAPERAIRLLQELATTFTAPLTGRVAAEELAALRERGFDAPLPDDIHSRMRRAISLRNTKQTDEAWALFAQLVVDADADDPRTMAWIEKEAETFGWRTRNWDFLERYYADQLADTPDGEVAWKRYRVLVRGGRFREAVEAAEAALSTYAKHRSWRRKEELLGQTWMLAGEYDGAQELFDRAARRGGWSGRRAQFYAAFAGFMAGTDDADTLERLTAVVERGGRHALAARYWRSRLHARLGDEERAARDADRILEEAPHSWYGILVRAQRRRDDPMSSPRDGRWVGRPWLEPPALEGPALPLFRTTFPVARPVAAATRPRSPGFGFLRWSGEAQLDVPNPVPAFLQVDPNLPPPSYLAGALFDPARVEGRFRRWSAQHRSAWPDLEAAFDLARGGLYDLSGPLFSAIYEEWRRAYRNGASPKHGAARAMWMKPAAWRDLFAYARDHHHMARFYFDLWKTIDDPATALEAKRLAYPLAHDRYVWTHSREHGIDPYLVLGLMRQESTYNSIARSPVGARGAMQIMPRTGHLLANLQHDLHYDNGDLEDPTFAVGYGITYLGLLMERFEGVYPLAIASYNGGPFNVSSWLVGTGEMPIDAFVEHIPFRETRDYVKKVSAGYSTYLSLYAPEGTYLAPPEKPRGDHPEVVDF